MEDKIHLLYQQILYATKMVMMQKCAEIRMEILWFIP